MALHAPTYKNTHPRGVAASPRVPFYVPPPRRGTPGVSPKYDPRLPPGSKTPRPANLPTPRRGGIPAVPAANLSRKLMRAAGLAARRNLLGAAAEAAMEYSLAKMSVAGDPPPYSVSYTAGKWYFTGPGLLAPETSGLFGGTRHLASPSAFVDNVQMNIAYQYDYFGDMVPRPNRPTPWWYFTERFEYPWSATPLPNQQMDIWFDPMIWQTPNGRPKYNRPPQFEPGVQAIAFNLHRNGKMDIQLNPSPVRPRKNQREKKVRSKLVMGLAFLLDGLSEGADLLEILADAAGIDYDTPWYRDDKTKAWNAANLLFGMGMIENVDKLDFMEKFLLNEIEDRVVGWASGKYQKASKELGRSNYQLKGGNSYGYQGRQLPQIKDWNA